MTKWKLVPVEPDEAMADAAQAVPAGIGGCPPHWAHIYRAMIAASPAPPDVVAVLEGIKRDLQQPAEFYAKYGPTWTGKDGHEYEDTSTHLDFAAEIESKVVALIAQLKGESRD